MNIYESITNVMSESIAIGKDSYNQQQKFKYRGIDAVMNTFYPLFSKHKIFIVPEVLEQTREEKISKNGGNLIYSVLKVKYTFYAEDGSSISATVIGEGMDSADKASNKAMAVAMKYAMFQVFCIPTEEFIDPDGETPPESNKKPFDDVPPPQEPPITVEEAKHVVVKTNHGDVELQELSDNELEKAAEVLKGKYKEAAKILIADRKNDKGKDN